MSNTDRNTHIDPLEEFINGLMVLAIEHPHTAIISENRQFKSRFFNVYFKEAAEKYLSGVTLHPDYAYILASRLVAQGFTVKFIPKNSHGYCQCTITKPSGEANGLIEILTGEGGQMYRAVLSAIAKHFLCLETLSDGTSYWRGRQQNTLDNDSFR